MRRTGRNNVWGQWRTQKFVKGGLQVDNIVIESGPGHGPKTFSKLTFKIRVSLLRFLERIADA